MKGKDIKRLQEGGMRLLTLHNKMFGEVNLQHKGRGNGRKKYWQSDWRKEVKQKVAGH